MTKNKNKGRSHGRSLTQAVDPLFGLAATFSPEVFAYFANGGGINGFAKALSLKTGFDFTTGTFTPSNFIIGWGPVTMYRLGKKLPQIANKLLRRVG